MSNFLAYLLILATVTICGTVALVQLAESLPPTQAEIAMQK